ncbi:MAG TPA: oxygenase MpaB family protein [Iamia sp.]
MSTEPAFLLPSGPRALLLQVAHPAVSAGVADHSDYERRPWVRLIGTLDVMNKLAFGTPAGSARQARRLRERHAEIIGTQPDGTAYRALDAGNMLWVWATLVDTLVVSYERYVRRLSVEERDQLYREWKAIGRACGVPLARIPDTWADFTAYVASVVADDLGATETAVAVADQIVHPPLPRPLGPAVGRGLAALTAPVLPSSLRSGLGLGEPAAAADRLASAARRLASATPGKIRRTPLAIALSLWARPPSLPRLPSSLRPAPA